MTRRERHARDCAEQLACAVVHLRCFVACLRDAARSYVLAYQANAEPVPHRRDEDVRGWGWTSKGGDA